MTQRVDSILSLARLREVKQHRQQHNAGDDHEARDIARAGRKRAREQQDDDQRVAKEPGGSKPGRRALEAVGIVAAITQQSRRRLLRRQTAIRGG